MRFKIVTGNVQGLKKQKQKTFTNLILIFGLLFPPCNPAPHGAREAQKASTDDLFGSIYLIICLNKKNKSKACHILLWAKQFVSCLFSLDSFSSCVNTFTYLLHALHCYHPRTTCGSLNQECPVSVFTQMIVKFLPRLEAGGRGRSPLTDCAWSKYAGDHKPRQSLRLMGVNLRHVRR